MAFGNEIRYKISADASKLERTFEKAARTGVTAANTMDRAMKKMLGSAEMRLQDKLGAAREKRLYNEASTVGKIAIVTRELQDYAYARSQSQKNSVKYLQAQLAIEERLTRLRGLQQQQQSANAGGTSMAQQSAGVAGGAGFFGGIKGAVQSLALSAAYGVVTAMTSYFSRGMADAQRSEALTGSNAKSNSQTAAALGGMGAQKTALGQEDKALGRQIEVQENLIKSLTTGAYATVQNAVNPEWMQLVDSAKDTLKEMQTRQTEIKNESVLLTREMNRQQKFRQEDLRDINAITAAQKSGRYNALTAAKLQADTMIERAYVYEEVKKGGHGLGTPEERHAAWMAAGKSAAAEAVERQNMQQQLLSTNESLTGQATGGRFFRNGARRPRSETERLAERAAMFRERSRGMILTGAGQGAASALQSARRDEGAVGDRLSRATSAMPERDVADLTKLPTLIENSNQILTAIKESLRVNVVQLGNKK